MSCCAIEWGKDGLTEQRSNNARQTFDCLTNLINLNHSKTQAHLVIRD
jgi:hypothetical protein